jgi:hypothetical protein
MITTQMGRIMETMTMTAAALLPVVPGGESYARGSSMGSLSRTMKINPTHVAGVKNLRLVPTAGRLTRLNEVKIKVKDKLPLAPTVWRGGVPALRLKKKTLIVMTMLRIPLPRHLVTLL